MVHKLQNRSEHGLLRWTRSLIGSKEYRPNTFAKRWNCYNMTLNCWAGTILPDVNIVIQKQSKQCMGWRNSTVTTRQFLPNEPPALAEGLPRLPDYISPHANKCRYVVLCESDSQIESLENASLRHLFRTDLDRRNCDCTTSCIRHASKHPAYLAITEKRNSLALCQ